MTLLDAWAARWGVPLEAINDLKEALGVLGQTTPGEAKTSEAANQQRERFEASRNGGVLWRNNVGVAFDRHGVPVRYGLANDSKGVNDRVKSADLIGITPYQVTGLDVGRVLGLFTSVEVKRGGWRFTGDKREDAQLNWALLVISKGGLARFAS